MSFFSGVSQPTQLQALSEYFWRSLFISDNGCWVDMLCAYFGFAELSCISLQHEREWRIDWITCAHTISRNNLKCALVIRNLKEKKQQKIPLFQPERICFANILRKNYQKVAWKISCRRVASVSMWVYPAEILLLSYWTCISKQA